jgi:4'-phosphopantetheinyl transferase
MNATTIDVWLARLDLPAAQVSRLSNLLSQDEKARARGFVAAEGCNQFIAARAFLRTLLGQLLARDPASLRFRYGAFGKPALDLRGAELDFNLSHAGTLAAVAVAERAGDVGVDVERIKRLDDLDGVIHAAFTAREATRLLAVAQPMRLAAFYRAWTRKEAVLKARGRGLSGERCGPGRDAGWMASNFEVGGEYAGAVACSGAGWVVRSRAWCWPRPAESAGQAADKIS